MIYQLLGPKMPFWRQRDKCLIHKRLHIAKIRSVEDHAGAASSKDANFGIDMALSRQLDRPQGSASALVFLKSDNLTNEMCLFSLTGESPIWYKQSW
jgi:hypothetical protein